MSPTVVCSTDGPYGPSSTRKAGVFHRPIFPAGSLEHIAAIASTPWSRTSMLLLRKLDASSAFGPVPIVSGTSGCQR
jgi:hypothetical protein